MDIYRSAGEIPSPPAPRAVAIGNFDGLHLGHRRIVERLKTGAAARRIPTCVLTFSPHPEKVFGPARLRMVQTLDQRLRGLCEWDIDAVLVWPFDRAFAGRTGEAFAAEILAARLNARLVIVGDDFRFGRSRSAGPSDLERFGRTCGFAVRVVPRLKRGGRAVRSSRIRDLLTSGRVEDAAQLLDRPYSIEGDVVAGEGIGRTLGFPTANIQSPNEILPPGIFVTLLECRGRRYRSVSSIGIRPTFGKRDLTVECHLLDVRRELYGTPVRLFFLRKLRAERKFRGPDALRNRIAADAEAARAYFRRRPHL
jgi:riboflavin kinase / FMN adenylyltransferase